MNNIHYFPPSCLNPHSTFPGVGSEKYKSLSAAQKTIAVFAAIFAGLFFIIPGFLAFKWCVEKWSAEKTAASQLQHPSSAAPQPSDGELSTIPEESSSSPYLDFELPEEENAKVSDVVWGDLCASLSGEKIGPRKWRTENNRMKIETTKEYTTYLFYPSRIPIQEHGQIVMLTIHNNTPNAKVETRPFVHYNSNNSLVRQFLIGKCFVIDKDTNILIGPPDSNLNKMSETVYQFTYVYKDQSGKSEENYIQIIKKENSDYQVKSWGYTPYFDIEKRRQIDNYSWVTIW